MFPLVQLSSHVDPLIPPHEDVPAKLTRLSLNIATLTRLIDEAERRGMRHLTAMFDRFRQGKIEQAHACANSGNGVSHIEIVCARAAG